LRSAEAALAGLEREDPGRLANVFIIHGTETYYHQRLIRAVRRHVVDPVMEAFNFTSFENEGATLDAVRGAVLTPPVMAGRRLVVVRDPVDLATGGSRTSAGRRDDEDGSGESGDEDNDSGAGDDAAAGDDHGTGSTRPLTRAERTRRWASLFEEVGPDCHLLLALSRDLPGSNRLLKVAGKLDPPADIIRCFPATAKSAEVWVRKLAEALGASIDSGASQALVMRSGDDLTVLEREVEKLLAYVGDKERITIDDVMAVATASAEANVFELVDLIGNRRAYPAVLKLRRLLEQGEPALRLMAMVVRQVRQLHPRAAHRHAAHPRPDGPRDQDRPPRSGEGPGAVHSERGVLSHPACPPGSASRLSGTTRETLVCASRHHAGVGLHPVWRGGRDCQSPSRAAPVVVQDSRPTGRNS